MRGTILPDDAGDGADLLRGTGLDGPPDVASGAEDDAFPGTGPCPEAGTPREGTPPEGPATREEPAAEVEPAAREEPAAEVEATARGGAADPRGGAPAPEGADLRTAGIGVAWFSR